MSNAVFPPITPDIYGPIIAAADVRKAVADTIKLWADPYIAVLAARTGAGLVPFATYEATYDRRNLPPDSAASCWVVAPGTRKLERQGDGTYIATWVVETQIVMYGTDWAMTSDYAAWYNAAVRALLVQHGSLGLVTGLLKGPLADAESIATTWRRERYTPVEAERASSIIVAQSQYDVVVDGVVDTSAGPKKLPAPAAGTQGNLPVTDVIITVTKTGVDGMPPYV